MPRFLFALLLTTALASSDAGELSSFPDKVTLHGSLERRQLLIELDGRDVTREVKYRSEKSDVATVDETGYVTPLSEGTTAIEVEYAGVKLTVPVTVLNFAADKPVDFKNDIEPILSRHGCNSGGCHGKATGQNGFRLSLFGFDEAFDYDALITQSRGRRVQIASPHRSLLLRKGTGELPHGGGKRLEPESEAYNTVVRWIAGGAPRASAEAAKVVKLRVHPQQKIMKRDEPRQLAVLAEYSDGSERDVTRQAAFSSNLEVVAAVNEEGFVRTGEQAGEAAIMARYMGQVAVFTAILPHGKPLEAIPGWSPNNYVDELAAEKWRKLGLQPSPLCDDATYLRRITVDICGRLPTPEEVRAFADDASPDKRARCVDRLLDSPDYAAFFALRWSSILRNSNQAGATQSAYAFHNWIKDNLARNRPYDELVRGVVAAAGEWQDSPAINWYWQSRDDQLHQVAADTAQLFLGLRLQCARCHHHPYERWGQEDYYGLTGFFTRLGRKSFGEPPPYFSAATPTTGEKNPLTNKTPEPKYLDGEYVKFTAEEDPRHALVDWMVKPENPYFARTVVNRYWGHFLGRGLVHEIDDMRETNPPSNPELLNALSKDFVEHKFDLKHLVRTIVTSKVYQLSSDPTEHNRHDQQNFARYYAKRMIAEVLLDAVDQATGSRTRFSGVSSEGRAVDLPHEGFGSYFLDTFDRPRRVTSCECERSSSATLSQVMLLANSDEIENKIADEKGKVAGLVKDKRSTAEAIDDLYLSSISRRPTAEESAKGVAFVEKLPVEQRRQALEDVLWSLLNSREFMFNH